MKKWEQLPPNMQNAAVRPYYDSLQRRQGFLFVKRWFDIVASLLLIVILSPVLLVLSVWIKLDSKGPVFYRQERITQYGRPFRIFKFRTMVTNADQIGALVTTQGDARITRVGQRIRRGRLDELPQLFNILSGDMSFVGTRPEVRHYVDAYTDEMWATLLLPAGVTSPASIAYKDEDERLSTLTGQGMSTDEAYIRHILPEKMAFNLQYLRQCSMKQDLLTCIRTVI